MKRLLFFGPVLSVGFAAGTIFGFYSGMGAAITLDSTPKALLSISHLRAIQSGKAEASKQILESDVDTALALYSALHTSWWSPAFSSGWLLVNPDDHARYIRKIANYRKMNPSLIKDDMFDIVPNGEEAKAAEYRDMALGLREHKRRVQGIVEKYADN